MGWKRMLIGAERVKRAYEEASGLFFLLTLVLTVFQKGLLVTFAFAGLIIVAVSWLTVKAYEARKRLKLQGRWQILAWTHYRGVLAEAQAKSLHQGVLKIDFLTFYNGQFEDRINKFYQEIQYVADSYPHLDAVIFDIEYFDDLRDGVMFGDRQFRLIPYESFMEYPIDLQQLSLPEVVRKVLCVQGVGTLALPLRWGYTGFGRKLQPGVGGCLANEPSIDIDWLINDTDERGWLKENPCLVTLDWYLPTMMLLALRFGAAHDSLTPDQFKRLVEMMENLAPLMRKDKPLFEDPWELAKEVNSCNKLIVIGGGNWLWSSQSPESERVSVVPSRSGYLIWCECLGFLHHNDNPSRGWCRDANTFVKWIIHPDRRDAIARTARFHAFDPFKDPMPPLPRNLCFRRVLPPRQHKVFVCRKEWEEAWENWKKDLQC
jgi:hypothetical protein